MIFENVLPVIASELNARFNTSFFTPAPHLQDLEFYTGLPIGADPLPPPAARLEVVGRHPHKDEIRDGLQDWITARSLQRGAMAHYRRLQQQAGQRLDFDDLRVRDVGEAAELRRYVDTARHLAECRCLYKVSMDLLHCAPGRAAHQFTVALQKLREDQHLLREVSVEERQKIAKTTNIDVDNLLSEYEKEMEEAELMRDQAKPEWLKEWEVTQEAPPKQ